VEAAGYGQQETGYSGKREFTAEPIAYFYGSKVTINGEGEHGVCFGDSGGPMMVIASDGSVRVAGTLSSGDTSCVGYDNYTRVDLVLSWIEGYTGPTQLPGPQPCDETTAVGLCNGDATRATWCNADKVLESVQCTSNERCSWSTGDEGWRCVNEANDACNGLSYAGSCAGNVLSWCDVGGLQERDCAACDEICVSDSQGGFRCAKSECGDLTVVGICDGETVKRCTSTGKVQIVDCADYGDHCSWVNHLIGPWCVTEVKESPCENLSFYGYCEGDVVHWCNRDGLPDSLDCSQTSQSCEWLDSSSGFYCK
jgi:hypothetical protein